VEIFGYLAQMGGLRLQLQDRAAIDRNPFFCAEPARVPELEAMIDALRRDGDSIGARVNVVATGVPVGLGEPVFDRLDADLAHAMMSINAVKGVEIGAGFASVEQRGSEHRDEMTPQGFLSNHAGGTLGGISSGQDLLVSMAIKPTSSIVKPGRSIDVTGAPVEVVTPGATIPASGSGRCRSPRRCWRSCWPTIACDTGPRTPRSARPRRASPDPRVSVAQPAELCSASGKRPPKGLQRRLQRRSCWVPTGPWAIVMLIG
jgi:hypothetical protein